MKLITAKNQPDKPDEARDPFAKTASKGSGVFDLAASSKTPDPFNGSGLNESLITHQG